MPTWHELMEKEGRVPEWPYPIHYDKEQEIETDILVIGGGIAGCWAAISAARYGVRVALVEKADTIRSGAGGPGCDHWCNVPANPHSKVNPDEWAQRMSGRPYANGIGNQIQCREDYDTLLELEQMGGKIRDVDDEYMGVEGRYDDTKFMFSPRYSPNHSTEVVIRVWGTTFKPALKKECQRLGVKIYDRVMVTSLLTEDGIQGTKVVGATGFNDRTGEFMVFKSKATILCTAGAGSLWLLNMELAGYCTQMPRTISSDGIAMAWRAGAELTMMERSGIRDFNTGFKHKFFTSAGDPSYENLQLVDNNGKKLPWPTQGWSDGGALFPTSEVLESIRDGVLKGKYALPFYGDFPNMPEVERKATWNLMLGEESTTRILTNTFMKSGFDPSKDLLQSYRFIEGHSPPQWRDADWGGGLIVDWDLKTNLDGLYAAGGIIHSPGDHSFAASTGRYAGRKAADYIQRVGEPVISKEQVATEKARIHAPIKRTYGIEWKELHAGMARTMQFFCSEFKTEPLFRIGLNTLKDIEENWVPKLYALDPHKLMRSLEDLSMLTHAQIILHASLARRASSEMLEFYRIDYPALDPPEWNKFITVKLEDEKVKVGELSFDYGGNLKENYEAHNNDYTGVYES